MNNLFNYIDRPSPIHRLTGATKFVCLMLWSAAAMSTYDTRFLAILGAASLVMFKVSRIKYKDVSFLLSFTFVFLIMNNILVYLSAPFTAVRYTIPQPICSPTRVILRPLQSNCFTT